MNLKYYKLREDAKEPVFGSKDAACFDLSCVFDFNQVVSLYLDDKDKKQGRPARVDKDSLPYVLIYPNERMLIPTGLVFDIPEGYSMRLHARSGVALKRGLTLVNSEGVIDSDYVEEVYAAVVNLSNVAQIIQSGERICQGELVKSLKYQIKEVTQRPEQKTDRDGGFGSTGTK